MKSGIVIVMLLPLLGTSANGQKMFTRNGKLSFTSEAPMEKIEAITSSGMSVWDTETGALEMQVLVKTFQFEKALMEEHFNENYMETAQYPKASFKGQFTDHESIDLNTSGTYTSSIAGELTMHGKTQPVNAEVTIVVDGASVRATTSFDVQLADYDIKIPKVVKDNIAKVVTISVMADYKPLSK